MFYFTQTSFDNLQSGTIESAVRAYSSKRHTSLDLNSSSSYIKEDKYFLGLDGKNDLQITRIRTPFERFLPKLIVSFSKERHFETYRIRYSILPAILFFFLTFSVLASIFYLVYERETENDVLSTLGIFTIFLILTFIEIKLTKQKIDRAIDKYCQSK